MQTKDQKFRFPAVLAIAACLSFGQAPTWTKLGSPESPSPRSNHGMVFDVARSEVVLFGGYLGAGQGRSPETWVWNGANWELRPTGDHPSPYGDFNVAYDAARSRVVFFGSSADTWTWDGAVWMQRYPDHNPGSRYGHVMTYDPLRQKVILFGGGGGPTGFLSDTWAWNGEDWEVMSTSTNPPGRLGHMLAFDEQRGEVVLFGGFGETGHRDDTWVLSGTGWIPRDVGPRPGRRYFGAMAYAPTLGKTVLFGGSAGSRYNDTWTWDGESWSLLGGVPPIPDGRDTHAMTFDGARRQLIMFGGAAPGPPPTYETLFGDTWVLGSSQPDLTISASAPSSVVTGSEIQYAITASNAGQSTASPVYFYQYLPLGATLQDCGVTTTSPGGVSYSSYVGDPEGIGQTACVTAFPSFPAGTSASIINQFRIGCGLANGASITSSVKASTPSLESQYANNQATVIAAALNPPPVVTPPAAVEAGTSSVASACSAMIPDSVLGPAVVSDNCADGVQLSRTGVPAGNVFPVGATVLSFRATDAGGASATANQSVTVVDRTAPRITSLSVDKPILWPPNNKMTTVTVTAIAFDNCGSATCRITSVTAPNAGPGDWAITGDLKVSLRATRPGDSASRIYTIGVECRDSQANAATKAVIVTVPHDQGK